MRLLRRVLGCLPPIAFVAVLSLPLAQRLFPFAPAVPLGGQVAVDPPVAMHAIASWHNGSLQTEVEARWVKELGLRDWMVRIDNQWKWSWFSVTKYPVVCLRHGWLVEQSYLPSHRHVSKAQAEDLGMKALVLLAAQRVLREHGVTLVVLITPSKVETMPELLPLPHDLVRAAGHPDYLGVLRAIFALDCFTYLDGQRLFTEWREQDTTLALFPRAGVHWSRLGAAKVAVRLLDLLQQVSGFDLVDFELAAVRHSSGPGPGEDDMAQVANLLDATAFVEPMPIPVLQPRSGDTGAAPGVLLVGSSFGWELANCLADPRVVAPLTMFYYFKSAVDWVDGQRGPSRPIDFAPAALRAEILRHRFVVIECNVSLIHDLGFGFTNAVLGAFGLPQDLALPELPPDKVAAIQRAMLERAR